MWAAVSLASVTHTLRSVLLTPDSRHFGLMLTEMKGNISIAAELLLCQTGGSFQKWHDIDSEDFLIWTASALHSGLLVIINHEVLLSRNQLKGLQPHFSPKATEHWCFRQVVVCTAGIFCLLTCGGALWLDLVNKQTKHTFASLFWSAGRSARLLHSFTKSNLSLITIDDTAPSDYSEEAH